MSIETVSGLSWLPLATGASLVEVFQMRQNRLACEKSMTFRQSQFEQPADTRCRDIYQPFMLSALARVIRRSVCGFHIFLEKQGLCLVKFANAWE
jgi:hypothetical protein